LQCAFNLLLQQTIGGAAIGALQLIRNKPGWTKPLSGNFLPAMGIVKRKANRDRSKGLGTNAGRGEERDKPLSGGLQFVLNFA
jgi:hypothetical protein